MCLKEHAPETTHDLKKKKFSFCGSSFSSFSLLASLFPGKEGSPAFFPLSLTKSHARRVCCPAAARRKQPPPQHDSEEDEAIGVVDARRRSRRRRRHRWRHRFHRSRALLLDRGALFYLFTLRLRWEASLAGFVGVTGVDDAQSAPASGEKVFRFCFFPFFFPICSCRPVSLSTFLFTFFSPPLLPQHHTKNTSPPQPPLRPQRHGPQGRSSSTRKQLTMTKRIPCGSSSGSETRGLATTARGTTSASPPSTSWRNEHANRVDKVQCNAAVGKGRIGGGGQLVSRSSGETINFHERLRGVGREARSVLSGPAGAHPGSVRRPRHRRGHHAPARQGRARRPQRHEEHHELSETTQRAKKDFPRVRLGSAAPPGHVPVVAWVLQSF